MALEPGAVPVPKNPIMNRIERQAATHGLATILANLSGPDLQSLLLEVYRQQAARRTPAAILAEHSRSRFTRPSQGSAKAFASLERLAHENLPPDFEVLELSPFALSRPVPLSPPWDRIGASLPFGIRK